MPTSKRRLWESLQSIAKISAENRRAVLCLCRNLVFAGDLSIAVEFFKDLQHSLNILSLRAKAIEQLVEVRDILEKFAEEVKGCPIIGLSFDKKGEPIVTVLLASVSAEWVNIYVCHRCTAINLQQFMYRPTINIAPQIERGKQHQRCGNICEELVTLDCIGVPHETLLDTVALAVHLHCSVAVSMNGLHCLDEGINGGKICMWPWNEEDFTPICHRQDNTNNNMPSGNDFTIGINFKKAGCAMPCVIITTYFCN